MNGFTPGQKEEPVNLNVAKSGQDPRMYVALDEQLNNAKDAKDTKDNKEAQETVKTPKVQGLYKEPQDSQRAKDYELLRLRQEDLKLIVEGNHPLAKEIPDPHNMSKTQWDDYGKSVFGEDTDRKFFASESRQACLNKMKENSDSLDASMSNEKPMI